MNPCTTDTCNAATHQCEHAKIDGPEPGFTDTVQDCKKEVCVAGVTTQVNDDTDVPANTNVCVTFGCMNGTQTTTNASATTSCGTNPPQTCDGMGNCVGCTKDSDCPDPGTDCKTRKCTNKVCGTTDVGMDMSCSTMGGKFCDGVGTCVPCNHDPQCTANASDVCNNHQCVSSCGDNVKDGKETDKDCGGPCPKCADTKMCANNTDCTSGKCTGGTCAAPTCSDSVKNQGEGDVDCGGPCSGCADGKTCGGNGDCTSGACAGGLCISCMDTKKNGTETDVDCGGSCSTKCANGKACVVDGDCASTHCSGGLCFSCTDTMKNGNETDVDCGGSTCPNKCADGKGCKVDGDCTSAHCSGTVCLPTNCFNGTKDAPETDIDCGGGTCLKCGGGKTCSGNADCMSNNCKPNNTCM
jgi:hypothetical protein